MADTINLPTDSDRVAVIGSTGSGKTVNAAWLLSTRRFDRMPWVIFDFKGDKLLNRLGAKEIPVTGKPPKRPGLYIVKPTAKVHDAEVESFLWACHAQEDIGIYIDEGFMIPNRSAAFQAILTQGRSKSIPMIVLTQRPAWVSRFVFSEADFFAVFRLNDSEDVLTVQRFIGKRGRAMVNKGLPPYHFVWFEVGGGAGNGRADLCSPVPKPVEIIADIKARLNPQRQVQPSERVVV